MQPGQLLTTAFSVRDERELKAWGRENEVHGCSSLEYVWREEGFGGLCRRLDVWGFHALFIYGWLGHAIIAPSRLRDLM